MLSLGVVAATAAAPVFAQAAAPASADGQGVPPSCTQRPLSDVPNAAAIRARVRSPRLDDGWVPQGVAVGGGYLWVAAYRSTDAKQNRGPCRVFRVDPADGVVAGHFALPAACGTGTGRMVQVSKRNVLAHIAAGDAALDERAARGTLPSADQTQGAAVAADGFLWLTLSDGRFGRLRKIDAETGIVMASFAMPAGIEDLEFAPDGRLWTVSEAGSQRRSGWRTFYPVVFSVDIGALR